MIHISETLAIQTIEGFLGEEDIERLCKIMDEALLTADWQPRDGGDLMHVPPEAEDILQNAFAAALPAIRRSMPSIAAAVRFGYTEVRAGQSVPVHLDGIHNPHQPPRRIGRFGVTIADADEGGEFYVATTGSPTPWTGTVLGEDDGYSPGTPLAHRLDHEATRASGEPNWVADVPQTRWICQAPAGVAVAYGAQLIHGITPVTSGLLRKFVCDLTDAPGRARK